MIKLAQILFIGLCLTLVAVARAAEGAQAQLPEWQVLEFEEKAYWVTARSRLEILPSADDKQHGELRVTNSVADNSEQIVLRFDPATGKALSRSRLSRGKDQRLKLYQYQNDFITRERHNPGADAAGPPEKWPVTYSGRVPYPATANDTVVTESYMLLLIAQRLQAQGADQSKEVIVHTDVNFYRVRLTSGKGIAVNADYKLTGGERVSGSRETMGVVMHVTPIGTLEEKDDFSLFGLRGEIIVFFDRISGLPLQIRGVAPRIGSTAINLKAVTMRES